MSENFDPKISKILTCFLRDKKILDPPLKKSRKMFDPKLRQMSSFDLSFPSQKFRKNIARDFFLYIQGVCFFSLKLRMFVDFRLRRQEKKQKNILTFFLEKISTLTFGKRRISQRSLLDLAFSKT